MHIKKSFSKDFYFIVQSNTTAMWQKQRVSGTVTRQQAYLKTIFFLNFRCKFPEHNREYICQQLEIQKLLINMTYQSYDSDRNLVKIIA